MVLSTDLKDCPPYPGTSEHAALQAHSVTAGWRTCFSGSLSQKSLTMGLDGVGPAAGALGACCAAWPAGRLPRAPFSGGGGGGGLQPLQHLSRWQKQAVGGLRCDGSPSLLLYVHSNLLHP